MELDAFICGSDQIWERGLTGGLDPVYFLDFNARTKKISYGASKFFPRISERDTAWFTEKLRSFDAVSTRETELSAALKSQCGIEADTVLDPTLLLDAEDYLPLAESTGAVAPFVLAYFLSEDEGILRSAKKIAELQNLPLVEIHFYRTNRDVAGQIADCGPGEFLRYFQTASFVVTNSFHGVVFSILFQRPFYAVYDKDSRKDNLLKKLCLEERHIHTSEEIGRNTPDVPFAAALTALREERKQSLGFLEKGLAL